MGVSLRRVGTLAATLFAVVAGSAQATSFTVSSDLDTGGTCTATPTTCTLRQAIASANAHAGADVIQFTAGAHTITPGSALPAITGQTDIEAGNQVELDGASAGAAVSGLTLGPGSGNSTVAGVTINDFSADGILVDGSNFTAVRSSFIGTDPAADLGHGNGLAGVAITASVGVHIGDFSSGLQNGNTIGGNGGDGIDVGATATATIELNHIGISGFTATPNGGDGIRLSGPSSVVGDVGLGNTIVASGGNGITITGASADSNQIVGNDIGVDSSDELLGNQGDGVAIDGPGANIIGGTTAGAGNTISANGGDGISLNNTADNDIQGNRIGTTSDGRFLRSNLNFGIDIVSSPSNVIGGDTAGAGNQVSGNLNAGIRLENTTSSNNIIQGNLVGTNAAGTVALPNERGITAEGTNQIGGSTAGAGNVVSGNTGPGITVNNTGTSTVQGNIVGAGPSGTNPIPNDGDGIDVDQNAIVGGDGKAANVIAFNNGPGIQIENVQATVAGNSIFSNVGLGIDAGGVGVTPNDAGDTDGIQNFPVLTAAVSGDGRTTIAGTLDTAPNRTVTLSFYSSPSCDPSGFGEGKTLLTTDDPTTLDSGHETFSEGINSAIAPGQQITATAQGVGVGSSEFSACVNVVPLDHVALGSATQSAPEGSTATITVTRTGALNIDAFVNFATQDGTAKAGRDYRATQGGFHFAPGQTTKKIHIPILSDTAAEGDETFSVTLKSPSLLSIAQPSSVKVTIPGNHRPPASDLEGVPSHARAGQLHNFHGTASDPDHNLSKVAVSIVSARAVNGHCLSIKPGGGTSRGPGGRCQPRIFISAAGAGNWSLHLGRGLPRGTWIVISRAFDTTGLSETSFSRATHNLAVVQVS
jgi:hypothetical protein